MNMSAFIPTNMALPATYSMLDSVMETSYDEEKGPLTLSSAMNANQDNGADGIPSRVAVKNNSLETTIEAQKKSELEIRRKRLQDRMAGRGSNEPDVGAGLASIARLKAQRSMADRLSTVRSLTTLPAGVMISDDVMTKTEAFLHQVPDLQ
jgi:hypothetical protein